MGRMLDTFQPAEVLVNIWFMRKAVDCGAWPGAPMLNMIGTNTWAVPSESMMTLSAPVSGASFQVPSCRA